MSIKKEALDPERLKFRSAILKTVHDAAKKKLPTANTTVKEDRNTDDFKVVVDSNGKMRKVKAHRIHFKNDPYVRNDDGTKEDEKDVKESVDGSGRMEFHSNLDAWKKHVEKLGHKVELSPANEKDFVGRPCTHVAVDKNSKVVGKFRHSKTSSAGYVKEDVGLDEAKEHSYHIAVGKGGWIDYPRKSERIRDLKDNGIPHKIGHSPYEDHILVTVPGTHAKRLQKLFHPNIGHFKEEILDESPENAWRNRMKKRGATKFQDAQKEKESTSQYTHAIDKDGKKVGSFDRAGRKEINEGITDHEAIAKHLINLHGKDITKDKVKDSIQDMDEPHKIDHDEVWEHILKKQKGTDMNKEEYEPLTEGGVGGLVPFYKPGTKEINHDGIKKAGAALSRGLNNGKPIVSKTWNAKTKKFEVRKESTEVPFDGPYTKSDSVTPRKGPDGREISTVRKLARDAIPKSKGSKIAKDAHKKAKEKFDPNPTMTSLVFKN